MKTMKNYSYIIVVLAMALLGLILLGYGVAKNSEALAFSGFLPLTLAALYYFRVVQRLGSIIPK